MKLICKRDITKKTHKEMEKIKKVNKKCKVWKIGGILFLWWGGGSHHSSREFKLKIRNTFCT